jgi:hypothetical protein
MSLENISDRTLTLRSIFHGEVIGTAVLSPKMQRSERFDWASSDPIIARGVGPVSTDYYIIEVFDQSGHRLSVHNIIRFSDSVEGLNCKTSQCLRADLNMNRGESTVGGEAISTARPVQYAKMGDLIELAASKSKCGCIALTNKSLRRVKLTATLHDSVIGEMDIEPEETERIRFDWAGENDHDVYAIKAADASSNASLRIKDVISLGVYSEMQGCTRVGCGFGTLNLSSAFNASSR